MSFNAKLRINQKPTGTVGVSGAAPQTVTGQTVLLNDIKQGTLCANLSVTATTNTLTLTARWQVSNDGTNWVDARGANNASNVVLVTGTGSAVSDSPSLSAPDAVYGKRYARCVVVSGVAAGAGAPGDQASISYNWLAPDL